MNAIIILKLNFIPQELKYKLFNFVNFEKNFQMNLNQDFLDLFIHCFRCIKNLNFNLIINQYSLIIKNYLIL